MQVKVNKASYLEVVWASLGSSEPSGPIPQQRFRRANEVPLGACSATCLAEGCEEAPGAIQEWDVWNSACAILHTGNSWYYRHDGYLGSLAPELSLPHHYVGRTWFPMTWLAGQSRVCKCHEDFWSCLNFIVVVILFLMSLVCQVLVDLKHWLI